jgi:hypothetical protein
VPSRVWGHSHCLVLNRGDLLFDPTVAFRFDLLAKLLGLEPGAIEAAGIRVSQWSPSDVKFGVSFGTVENTHKKEVTRWRLLLRRG